MIKSGAVARRRWPGVSAAAQPPKARAAHAAPLFQTALLITTAHLAEHRGRRSGRRVWRSISRRSLCIRGAALAVDHACE